MNAIVKRWPTGNAADPVVLLNYGDPSTRRAHHDQQGPQIGDRRRVALIRAERELVVLEIIVEHLDLSDIALTRIADALHAIRRALDLNRPACGLQPQQVQQ
jgi:hypothetical protein